MPFVASVKKDPPNCMWLKKSEIKCFTFFRVFLLTLGVNFTNILSAVFVCPDPKAPKKTDNLNIFFAILGSACVKAGHEMLMKLTSGLFFN